MGTFAFVQHILVTKTPMKGCSKFTQCFSSSEGNLVAVKGE